MHVHRRYIHQLHSWTCFFVGCCCNSLNMLYNNALSVLLHVSMKGDDRNSCCCHDGVVISLCTDSQFSCPLLLTCQGWSIAWARTLLVFGSSLHFTPRHKCRWHTLYFHATNKITYTLTYKTHLHTHTFMRYYILSFCNVLHFYCNVQVLLCILLNILSQLCGFIVLVSLVYS